MLAQPPGSIDGRLKLTEQGEVIFAQYGDQDIAARHLEQMASATLFASTPSNEARKLWLNELSRRATEQEVELSSLHITPAQVARIIALVAEGTLTNKLARQVVEGVLAGEGEPDAVVEARGLEVVSDDGALGAAVDEAISGNPDVVEKIRGGKAQAAGALIGQVMKEMKGKADAARVRELVVERVGS